MNRKRARPIEIALPLLIGAALVTACGSDSLDEAGNSQDAAIEHAEQVDGSVFDATSSDAWSPTDAAAPDGSTPPDAGSPDNSGVPPTKPGLPLGGVMYGNPLGGTGTGNSAKVAHMASVRFRAEKTGELSKLRWHNRWLSQQTIKDRCKSSTDVWCKCLDSGLDNYLCGYTTGNMYHVGNGGLTELSIQADDGSAKHLPSGKVLASIVVPTASQGGFGNPHAYVPVLTDSYVTFPLDKKVKVSAGGIYHIVVHNRRPPVKCPKGAGYSLAAAKSCDRDRGSQGLNGIFVSDVPSLSSGPLYGFMSLRKDAASADWSVYKGTNVGPWYVVEYADGDAFGNGYTFYNSGSHVRHIGGNNKVRQRFTVMDADRSVNGFWLRVGRKSSTGAGDLSATLSGGGVNVSVAVPAANISQSSDLTSAVIEWAHVSFPQDVTLKQGTEYALTLSAGASADYFANAGFDFNGMSNMNSWDNARAEYSTNGSWKPMRSDGWAGEEDLSLAFTITGQPKVFQY